MGGSLSWMLRLIIKLKYFKSRSIEYNGPLIYDKNDSEDGGGGWAVFPISGAPLDGISIGWHLHWMASLGKINVVTASQQAVDFVRFDVGILVMFLRHGPYLLKIHSEIFTGEMIFYLRFPLK